MFRLRRRGTVDIKSSGSFGRYDADFEPASTRESTANVADFTGGTPPRKVTLAIDVRDCIGCEICVAHCNQGVLKMVDGKALIDLRNINHCNADGECVDVCPTDVVTLAFEEIAQAEPMPLNGTTDDDLPLAG